MGWEILTLFCVSLLVKDVDRMSDCEERTGINLHRSRARTRGGGRRGPTWVSEWKKKNVRSFDSWFIPGIFPKMHWPEEEVYCEERAGMTPFTAPRWHRRVYKEPKHLTKKHKYHQPICISSKKTLLIVGHSCVTEIMYTIKVGTTRAHNTVVGRGRSLLNPVSPGSRTVFPRAVGYRHVRADPLSPCDSTSSRN